MVNTPNLSDTKRALLEKYLRGNTLQATITTPAIPRRAEEGYAPLSYGQQQLWLLAQLVPDTPVYNECVTIHLPGPLDKTVLEQSLNEFIRRHITWRTSFPLVDGQPVQMIHPPPVVTIPMVDLRHLPAHQRGAEARRLATVDARGLFDLEHGPLLRSILTRLADDEHQWFLTLHHIIFDGVAIYQVFLPELRAIYEAFLAGRPSPLSELPIQYTDYAAWQRQSIHEDAFARQVAYWKKQLQGAPASLELPADRPRPPIQSYRGSMQPFAISKHLTGRLKALASHEGVTLYMLLVAAFKTLLHRYTGQDDLLIGTATAGRKHPEVQKLMGFFLDTLVLRTDLSGDPTFRGLLKRVRDVVLSAVANEDVPFEYLVKELHPERNLYQNPLFQVLLTLEPPLTLLPSGWTLTQMDVTVGISKFDLSLELDDRPEGLIGRFEYNTDLFDATTIERMVGHWQTLLEGIVTDSSRRLSDLPLLTVAERRQLIVEWNSTRVAYPHNRCIHQLFEEQVARTPDAVAVVYKDSLLTFRELNARANALAHYLRHLGVGADMLVGLCVERSLDMLVGLLGILKAGGAYVPLDPMYPSERLAFMLNDAGITALVTQRHLLDHLAASDTRVLCLDADRELLAGQSTANPLPVSTSDNLAYVIYTSGSTGRPKGVQIPHRALTNFMISMTQQPGLTAEDALLAVTTLSFDIAALELFLPLLVGARLIVADRDVIADGVALLELLNRSRATVMQATPITWRMLLAAGWQGSPHLKALCGGEMWPLELARQLLPRVASLWNMYGPTETTIWSTICKIEAEDEVITIGRPIANTQVYILDKQLHPVPVGVPGELYIGGDGLARGYLHRPELTAERFIRHPFSPEREAYLYNTGDLARYRPDGTIECLGRVDHQVKIRGFRIELGEVEAVLSQHDAVRQAIVVAREDIPGDKRLVAYIVLHENQPVTVGDLQRHAMKQLPSYMLPSTIGIVEALPLTPNGKVDRRALPAIEQPQPKPDRNFVAPRTETEKIVGDIWLRVLGIEQADVHDDFFDLGGHSLLATQVISRLRTHFQVDMNMCHFFEARTVARLSEKIKELRARSAESQIPALHSTSREAYRMKLSSPLKRNNHDSCSERERLTQ